MPASEHGAPHLTARARTYGSTGRPAWGALAGELREEIKAMKVGELQDPTLHNENSLRETEYAAMI